MGIKKNPISNDLWSWIKHRLAIKGLSWCTLACKYNYSSSAFKKTKNYAYPATERIIADILGLPPQDLFSNRYTPAGKPIGRNYPRERRLSKRKIVCNGKDSGARSNDGVTEIPQGEQKS